mgnify:CR=1 FL=1
MPADDAGKIIAPRIEAVEGSTTRCCTTGVRCSTQFTLVNASADYKNADRLATVADVDVQVTLSAGAESASYQRRLALETTSVDLKDTIHVPLTSET